MSSTGDISVAPKLCTCGKRGWRRRTDAEAELLRITVLARSVGRKERRIYSCHASPLWHLTSKPMRNVALQIDWTDEAAVKQIIDEHVMRPDEAVWEALTSPDVAAHTLRLLVEVQAEHQARSVYIRAQYRAELQTLTGRYNAGCVRYSDVWAVKAKLAEWEQERKRLALELRNRLEQAGRVVAK